MPTQTQSPAQSQLEMVDEENGVIRQVQKGLEIEQKSEHGATIIEGYVATKGVDRKRDFYTEEALRKMAQQINEEAAEGEATLEVMFPDFSEEDLKNIKQNYNANGNVDHYNQPNNPLGDPRQVSAYRIVEASFDGFGVKIKAELFEDLPFGVPEAIKQGIKKGYLDGFSVEYVARKAAHIMKDGEVVRKITDAKFTGAALTGRPIQTNAKLTDAEFKSMIGQGNIELEERKSDTDKSFIKGLEEMGHENMSEQELKSMIEDAASNAVSDEIEDMKQELKNDITGDTMPEDQNTQDEPESDPEQDADSQDTVEDQEQKSELDEFKEEFEDVKQEVKSLQNTIEEKDERIEELEQKNDDMDALQEFKSELDEDLEDLKQEIKSATPENAPQQDTDEQRDESVSNQESKSRLEQQLEASSNPDQFIENQDLKSGIMDTHGVSESELEEAIEAAK